MICWQGDIPLVGGRPTKRANRGLRPNRIKKLSKRQRQALSQGLALDRETRTSSVQVFMQELADAEETQRSIKIPALWVSLVLGALALGIVGLLYRPSELPALGGQVGQTPEARQEEIAALLVKAESTPVAVRQG